MTLTTATLLPGILLVALGAPLIANNSAVVSSFKAMPRSRAAAVVFFGGGALWFLHVLYNLAEADLIAFQTPFPFMVGFAVLAIAAFFYIPDFLAVRGLSVLTLIAAWPLLMAGFMNFDQPLIYFQKVLVYVALTLAIYLGASPFRLRDFFQWLFAKPARARGLGAFLLAYGLLLSAIAFTF